jgi:biotin transport system substrate-specific component
MRAEDGWTAAAVAEGGESRARMALKLALAVAAVSVAARLALPIPGTPVPVSLQDLVVLAVGILLGPVQGAAAIVTYVTLGALGAPVFSNGHAGLAWLMGPTGGYLLAFPASAWVAGAAGRLGGGRLGWAVLLAGILVAQAVLFGGGVLQLALITGQGLSATAALAVTPFVPGIAVKTALLLGFGVLVEGRRRSLSRAAASGGTAGSGGGSAPRAG